MSYTGNASLVLSCLATMLPMFNVHRAQHGDYTALCFETEKAVTQASDPKSTK